MFSCSVPIRLRATAALRLAIDCFRYAASGESGELVSILDNHFCRLSVQRRQRRRIRVDKNPCAAMESAGDFRSTFKQQSRTSCCREITTPPPRPEQTFSLPKLKTPASPKLPTG